MELQLWSVGFDDGQIFSCFGNGLSIDGMLSVIFRNDKNCGSFTIKTEFTVTYKVRKLIWQVILK